MKKLFELFVTDATNYDFIELAESIRCADLEEVIALTGENNEGAVREIEASRSNTSKPYSLITREGELAAVYGIGNTQKPYIGISWLLGTHCLNRHKISMGLISKVDVPRISKGYDMVYNFVYSRHDEANRWVDSLNFEHVSTHSSLSFLDGNFRLYAWFKNDEIRSNFIQAFDPDELDKVVASRSNQPSNHVAHNFVSNSCNWR